MLDFKNDRFPAPGSLCFIGLITTISSCSLICFLHYLVFFTIWLINAFLWGMTADKEKTRFKTF